MIIALSDVHLGYYQSDVKNFKEFLESLKNNDEIEHVVLLGDFLDMWRREPAKLILEYYDVFEILRDFKAKVHYIIGNHDYHAIELKQHFLEHFNLEVSADLNLKKGDMDYYFIHGYQYEWEDRLALFNEFANILSLADDETGKDAERLWKFYHDLLPSMLAWIKNFFVQDIGRDALKRPGERLTGDKLNGIEKKALEELAEIAQTRAVENLFLVYGHTHRPGLKLNERIANTGSWVDDPLLPNVPKNTYVEISEAGAKLKYYF